MSWQKIAGYGELGDINWGFDSSQVRTDEWLRECQKHIGETVLLTGGGSFGKAWLAKLTGVSLGMLAGKPTPKVRLENLEPPMSSYGENIFEPWLGSWQISIYKEESLSEGELEMRKHVEKESKLRKEE
jgi:hypothetical protein